MRTTLTALLFLATTVIKAQELPQTYILSSAPRYTTETGYGYDLTDSPSKGSKSPFFFSIHVPDGNYRITVRLGSKKQAGVTTVRGESRRLFIDNLRTKKGEFIEKTFIINKRTPQISDKESVLIKPREKKKLNWDDKLTLEFNGEAPTCESIRIAPADSSVITLFLCGNSTVVDQDNEPWASWGQIIPCFFNDHVCVANYAESGESANTFISAGRLKKALTQMKAGDYLFMEFGHNDQKQKGAGKGAYYSYMTSLKTFIDEARARGAHPVLITPTQRRSFDSNGKIQDTHENYPEAMRWLAKKENIPLIDLNKMTRTLYEAMGIEGSKKAFVHYPAGSYPGQTQPLADNTHFNAYGACQIAKCVREGIKTVVPELAQYLEYAPAYNPAQPDDVQSFRWDISPFTEIEKPDGN